MRSLLFFISCLFLITTTATAQTYTTSDAGEGGSLDFQVYGNDSNEDAIPIPGLTASLEYLLGSTDGTTWVFDITITNTSSIESNLTGFGFDFDPAGNISSVSLSGASTFSDLYFGDSASGFPNVLGATVDLKHLDICVDTDGGSCKGSSGGLAMGDSDTFALTITLDSSVEQIALGNFGVRYQGFSYEGISSGVGMVTTVPEPATWLMMIIGFGIVSASTRRSRHKANIALS